MTGNQKKPKLSERLKNSGVNRATVITAVLLVVAIVTIVAVTVASNRSKDDEKTPLPKDTEKVTNAPESDPPATEPPVTNPPETDPPSSGVVAPVGDELPSLSLPVKGMLLKEHDASVQVYSTTMNDYRVHLGIDVLTEESAPVYAAADGKISKIWEDVKMGYCIAVEHSGELVTVYKNLAEELPEGISEGASVRAGQLIANVGNSAMVEVAEEPHLHFEMTVGGLSVDPLEYYDEAALTSLGIDSSYGE